jgi:hypothetical protein
VVLVDARAKSSTEHASFDEVEAAGGWCVQGSTTYSTAMSAAGSTCFAHGRTTLLAGCAQTQRLLDNGTRQPPSVEIHYKTVIQQNTVLL